MKDLEILKQISNSATSDLHHDCGHGLCCKTLNPGLLTLGQATVCHKMSQPWLNLKPQFVLHICSVIYIPIAYTFVC